MKKNLNIALAVLAIKVDEFLYANSYIKDIAISGEGVSNTLSIQTNGNAVSLKANGHFFTTINGKDLTPGFVNEIDSKWDGGGAITFNPSVSNWNTVNCFNTYH